MTETVKKELSKAKGIIDQMAQAGISPGDCAQLSFAIDHITIMGRDAVSDTLRYIDDWRVKKILMMLWLVVNGINLHVKMLHKLDI